MLSFVESVKKKLDTLKDGFNFDLLKKEKLLFMENKRKKSQNRQKVFILSHIRTERKKLVLMEPLFSYSRNLACTIYTVF